MDELVVEEDSFVWKEIEEAVGIWNVWELEELDDEKLSLVLLQAIFKSGS